ncbi:CLUMA_CG019377, isoform A [Clunio marinus]|uniref:CLUMA_CG019377, isoform A n=1 Tax=Clunio marinus TaxID=568069 RepID=A0A1J1J3A9_9DIPT|nr:CLUMA_CG019377, isoform A [Clunio marinus]
MKKVMWVREIIKKFAAEVCWASQKVTSFDLLNGSNFLQFSVLLLRTHSDKQLNFIDEFPIQYDCENKNK